MEKIVAGNSLSPRVLLLALNLAMSFAILALYVSSLYIILLVVLLITATVVAASTSDLTILRQERSLVVIMIVFAIFVFVAATLLFSYVGTALFYPLISIDVGLLLAYVAMRRTSRLPRKTSQSNLR